MTDSTAASEARANAPTRHLFIWTMILIAALRLCIFCTGLRSLHLAPAGTEPRFNFEHPWLSFDARSYRELARHGYARDQQGTPYLGGSTFTLIAYFPVVPLVSRAISCIMPIDAAMLVLSNGCSLVGFAFLYQWARRLKGERAAVICALLIATFPGAVAFTPGMTEGPFLMLVAIGLWLLQRHNFWRAAVIAGIATATRPTGIALAVIVPLYAWTCYASLPWSTRLTRFALLGLISLSGVIGYETFLWHRYKTPRAYFDAQTHWSYLEQRRVQREAADHIDRHSWEFYRDSLMRPPTWNRAIALGILAIIILGLARPNGIPRVTFLLPLVIFLMTSLPGRGLRISSVPRYESCAIPLFLFIALWLCPRHRTVALISLLILQFAVQIYYATLFPKEIWVG